MAGIKAKGTTLWMGDAGSPENFVKVANVKSISGPQYAVTIVDTTTHDTVGNFREKAAVLIDAGTLSFKANFDPANATQDPTVANSLFAVLNDLEERYFELRLSDANVGNEIMRFFGFVTKFSMMFPVDNVQEVDIEIVIDGEPTWS
jgi:hypothetical protein